MAPDTQLSNRTGQGGAVALFPLCLTATRRRNVEGSGTDGDDGISFLSMTEILVGSCSLRCKQSLKQVQVLKWCTEVAGLDLHHLELIFCAKQSFTNRTARFVISW